MNKTNKLQQEKRAAFRRFSKMGTAGLAVLSMSAFTDVSAQPLQTILKTDSVKEQIFPLVNLRSDTLFTIDGYTIKNSNPDTLHRDVPYGNGYNNYAEVYSNSYCNYFNYSNYGNNYSNYSNTYGDVNYSNNYVNYSNYSNNK